jgi:opacity protein-like surface antigen
MRLKSLFVLALVGLLAPGGAGSAEEVVGVAKGRVELSTAASFSYASEPGGGDDDLLTIQLPFRVGYLLGDRFGIEAEVLTTHIDFGIGGSTGFTAGGNLAFHFSPRARNTAFLLVGGGGGNAVDFNSLAVDTESTVTTLQAGLGLKSFLGRRAALRLEYRFTRYFVSEDDPDTSDEDLTTHRVLVGFSVFFR